MRGGTYLRRANKGSVATSVLKNWRQGLSGGHRDQDAPLELLHSAVPAVMAPCGNPSQVSSQATVLAHAKCSKYYKLATGPGG